MTIAEWCGFGAVMLYLLTIGVAKWSAAGTFDNANPRDPGFYQDPFRARALGAHQNGIETFPFFIAAILLAEFRAAPQSVIDTLAVLFLVVRVGYVFAYVGNRPSLRSALWTLGFLLNVGIYFLPLISR